MPTDPHSLLVLAASILVGGAFVATGMRLYANAEAAARILAGKNIPNPLFVVKAGAVIEIVLGALAVMGLFLPWVSLALAVFVLAATAMVHDFWRQSGQQREADLSIAIANLIMVGGLLGLAAATL